MDSFDFLGYRFVRELRFPRPKSMQKLKDTIRAKTKRTSGKSLTTIIHDLTPTLRGWFEYFKHSQKTTFRDWTGGFGCGCEASSENACQQRPTTEPFSQSQLSHSAIGRSRLWLYFLPGLPGHGTSGSSALHSLMRAAWLPTTARQVVGAMWRREVPPSRRLTAREQSLPWAMLSFPSHRLRVNYPAP